MLLAHHQTFQAGSAPCRIQMKQKSRDDDHVLFQIHPQPYELYLEQVHLRQVQ